MPEIRVRFAPSPTGYLHVGGLRTALFNYLFAARYGGRCLLRIEDTDRTRRVEDAEKNLIDSLSWAGIRFDEGPHLGGDCGPYIQSERLETYRRYAQQLIDAGKAYYCFCTEDDLKAMREAQTARGDDTRYDGRCRELSAETVTERLQQAIPGVIRMKVDRSDQDVVVDDLIRGSVRFSPEQIDDQVLMKSDGFPTYHLANVVDDHLMRISHVIRGEEWLPSTPKHIQLYRDFGWEPPAFAHLSLLLNADRSKLSKRQGDVATEDYRQKGFLPEALINFVALLGWHAADDREIFSLPELIEHFSLERVNKTGAVFDTDKLRWMNQQYLKQLTIDDLFDRLQPFLPETVRDAEPSPLKKAVSIVRDSLVTLADIGPRLAIFYDRQPTLTDETLLAQVKAETAQKVFQAFWAQLNTVETLTAENFGPLMKAVQKTTGIKGKPLWVPIRIAITHSEHGPDLTAMVDFFGLDKCRNLIEAVIFKG